MTRTRVALPDARMVAGHNAHCDAALASTAPVEHNSPGGHSEEIIYGHRRSGRARRSFRRDHPPTGRTTWRPSGSPDTAIGSAAAVLVHETGSDRERGSADARQHGERIETSWACRFPHGRRRRRHALTALRARSKSANCGRLWTASRFVFAQADLQQQALLLRPAPSATPPAARRCAGSPRPPPARRAAPRSCGRGRARARTGSPPRTGRPRRWRRPACSIGAAGTASICRPC